MDSYKIIPELFYDLIARIVPGAVAIYFITTAVDVKATDFILNALNNVPPLAESGLVIVLVFLGMSYVVGHLLTPLAALSNKIARVIRPASFTVLQDMLTKRHLNIVSTELVSFIKNDEIIKSIPAETAASRKEAIRTFFHIAKHLYRPSTTLMLAWLRQYRPTTGIQGMKISAELLMLKIIAAATAFAILLHVVSALFSQITFNWVFFLTAAAITLLSHLGVARHTQTLAWHCIENYYLAHVENTALTPDASTSITKDS
jgi:hypothetical protein